MKVKDREGPIKRTIEVLGQITRENLSKVIGQEVDFDKMIQILWALDPIFNPCDYCANEDCPLKLELLSEGQKVLDKLRKYGIVSIMITPLNCQAFSLKTRSYAIPGADKGTTRNN